MTVAALPDKLPIMANGDIIRLASIANKDANGYDTSSVPATPPAMAVSPPPITDATDYIRDRRNSRMAIIRRGSTPSYKRVTFRYETPSSVDHDETALLCAQRETERSTKSIGGGFFSKPVSFLGELSLDDHHRHSHQRLPKYSSVRDRPMETNEALSSHSRNPNHDEGARRHPSSALGKLRAVIKKLIVENRRQRLLASHWPHGPSEGSCPQTSNFEEGRKAITNTTSNQFELRVRPRTSSQDSTTATTTTPTPSEPPWTPMTEQLRINFQNMTNSMLEKQQKEKPLNQNLPHPLNDTLTNHCGPFLSTQTSPHYQATSSMTKEQSATSSRPKWPYSPPVPSRVPANPSNDQYLLRQPHRSTGNDAPNQNKSPVDTIGHRSITSNADHRRHLRSQSPQHQSYRRDLRKRWSAIVEGAITRHNNMTGSYHPRLVEQQVGSQQQPTALNKVTNHPHHQRTERSQNAKSSEKPLPTLRKGPQLPSENSQEIEGNSEDNLLSREETSHLEAQKQRNALDRRKEINEKNDQNAPLSVLRRRSTTETKSGSEKPRSIFGKSFTNTQCAWCTLFTIPHFRLVFQ